MENMIMTITFVIDFVELRFLFKIRFIASCRTEKNMTFETLNGPTYYYRYWYKHIARTWISVVIYSRQL